MTGQALDFTISVELRQDLRTWRTRAALVGVAAIQLRRAERASGLTGKACSPSSDGCLQRRSSGGSRGGHQSSS